MGHRIGRVWTAWALGLGAALAAAPAPASPLHAPGHKAKAQVPTEGPWFVRAGQVQDVYANTGRKPVALQAYFCLTPKPGGASRVDLQQEGRAPIEIQGCASVYLLLGPGDRLSLSDPGPTDAVGSYRFDLQGALK